MSDVTFFKLMIMTEHTIWCKHLILNYSQCLIRAIIHVKYFGISQVCSSNTSLNRKIIYHTFRIAFCLHKLITMRDVAHMLHLNVA